MDKNSIYQGTVENDNLNTALQTLIKYVGSIGGACFVLATLVIAICIIFGSISPKNVGKWWTAFFSCFAGAVLFFGAYLLDDVLVSLFPE